MDRETEYVALKILKANASITPSELDILHAISRAAKSSSTSTSGARHVLAVLDSFFHTGPNGVHLCLVFPIAGGDLQAHMRVLPERRFPGKMAKLVAKQVTEGLRFVHACGVIHGGKLG